MGRVKRKGLQRGVAGVEAAVGEVHQMKAAALCPEDDGLDERRGAAPQVVRTHETVEGLLKNGGACAVHVAAGEAGAADANAAAAAAPAAAPSGASAPAPAALRGQQ